MDFDFTRDEAEYVRERIVTQQPGTLLAECMATSNESRRGVDYPWEHPAVPSLLDRAARELAHAERFSLLAQGAYLLYNVMLAEAASAPA